MPAKEISYSRTTQPENVWRDRLRYFEARKEALVETIREFVEIESPSDNKAAADGMARFLAGKFEAIGGQARLHLATDFGDNLHVDFSAREKLKPVLLLGHFDTVYPMGTLEKMPCRIAMAGCTGRARSI